MMTDLSPRTRQPGPTVNNVTAPAPYPTVLAPNPSSAFLAQSMR
jgi:hypothetical protein